MNLLLNQTLRALFAAALLWALAPAHAHPWGPCFPEDLDGADEDIIVVITNL